MKPYSSITSAKQSGVKIKVIGKGSEGTREIKVMTVCFDDKGCENKSAIVVDGGEV